MPMIDVLAEQRRIRRAYLKSLKVGSFITCDGPMTRLAPTAAEEAARRAEADRVWKLSCGPW